MPSTKHLTDDLSRPQSSEYLYGYSYSGFLTLQQTFDKFIFQQQGVSMNITASIGLMPTAGFTTDEFKEVITPTLGIFYMLSFLFPVSRIVRALVHEKETRLREGMRMMGLASATYNVSWLIMLSLQVALTSLLMTRSASESIFQYSDDSLVFLYFLSFSLALVSMCFLMATFFSKAKTAALLGPVVFFASYFPYYAVNNPDLSTSMKILACLSPPVCFVVAGDIFMEYETGMIGVRWSNATAISTAGLSYWQCIGLLLLDAVLYGVLAWYLDKVLPSEFGSRKSPFFFLAGISHVLPHSRWLPSSSNRVMVTGEGEYMPANSTGSSSLSVPDAAYNDDNTVAANDEEDRLMMEPVAVELRVQEREGRCLQFLNVRKEYDSSTSILYSAPKERVVAVAGLTMTAYEGHITALLGHNGAGKSTTVSMLTGLVQFTSGDILVRGVSISADLEKVRRQLGVCPQHDILFPELTVREHLLLFGGIKGLSSDVVAGAAQDMLVEVGLADKANAKSRTLSGGQKRKLSLGMALIGDSKVVVLDEPTSGMDPFSRRLAWAVIQKHKRGRIILLITHYMDEVRKGSTLLTSQSECNFTYKSAHILLLWGLIKIEHVIVPIFALISLLCLRV